MSNLASLKREIERMKELARQKRPSECTCRYIEILESEPLTEEQERVLTANMACYERNHDHRAHAGFAYVELPAAS
jgi:hypothetical protein